jgi:hypothetical protein
MEFFYWCERQGDCEPDPRISGACAGCEIAMNLEFNRVMRDLEASGKLEGKGWSK